MSPESCHLSCLGSDPTARVVSDRSRKGLEPEGERRGGLPACPTACTSSQMRELPTLS